MSPRRISITMSLLMAAAFAEPVQNADKNTVLSTLGEIKEIRQIGDMTELVISTGQKNNIAYISKDGKYLFFGAIVDNHTAQNLTQQRLREVNKVDISKINLKDAIRIGSGKTKLIAIMDPKCSFCIKSYKWLKDKDVELNIFLSPLGGPDESVKILCNADPKKAFDQMLSNGEIDNKACVYNGEEVLKKHILASHIIGVSGTPVFITMSGQKIEGFDIQALQEVVGK